MAMPIGSRIRQLRKAARLTQAELAQKAGLLRETVTKLESGVRRCSDKTMKKLADSLGVSMVSMLYGTDYMDDYNILAEYHGQTVLVLQDKYNGHRKTLFSADEKSESVYAGRICQLDVCNAGYPHRHCCYDCRIYREMGCSFACQNRPDVCGSAESQNNAADHG